MLHRHRGTAKCLTVFLFGCWMLFGGQLWSQSRREHIYMNGKVVAVESQPDTTCGSFIDPINANVGSNAGSNSVTVISGASCAWTAASNSSWITITSGTSGNGRGVINFSVSANTGAIRTGTLTIAGQTFPVTQCGYALSPASIVMPLGGGTGSISVSCSSSCTWTATSNVSWITITGGSSGNGNGTVNYTVAANINAARTGTITVGGQTFTVNQASGCTYSISPASQNVAAAGGSSNVAVNCGSGCTWTATSNVSWITITGGSSGSSNGTISYSVAANTGAPRAGTLTIAGQTFTVTQCGYTLSSTSISMPLGGGNGSVNVACNSGCTWTATSNVSWITITGGSSGNGSGTVNYSVAANTSPSRTGTLTIAGQTFTVTQANGCAYSISPVNQSIASGGGSGNINVTCGSGCPWTATSNSSWITITGGSSGAGSGTVNYSVAANTSPARTGTITVAGQTFTVNQANGCVYGISPASQTIPPGGGAGSVSVSCDSSCAWTATSNNSWITITGGSSGGGNGTVSYSVAANSGAMRTGTLTIAGQTFTVSQSYQQPTSISFSIASGFAGVTNYTATVGNGANITVNVEYQFTPWGGGTQQTLTATIGPMNGSGQLTSTISRSETPGTRVYTRIKNAVGSDWVTLSPQPQFVIRPPQPTSFAFSPAFILPPGGNYIISVGNGASLTVEVFMEISVPPYPPQYGTTTITLDGNGQNNSYASCGYYVVALNVFAIRNVQDTGADAWATTSGQLSVSPCQ
jgi:hypothetical protein